MVARPVVQALPSAESRQLNEALARLARDPRNIDALIEAGDAANALGDPEAAAGFYRRADGISANNPRVQAGLARALVLQGDPTQAIPLFARAEAGGAAGEVAADRGLAYDLVGDPLTAQKYYRLALSREDDDEVRRRLGVSLAITGDAAGSEAMLMPLLRKQDKPGWRSHAFAMAIAGKTKEAVETVRAILPEPLAQSITPYLRYMPRLTRAQQAAAANLGKFPRAAEIGRDDPLIAAFASSAPTARVAAAGAQLIPQGRALGSGRTAVAQQSAAQPLSRAQTRAKERADRLARAQANAAARVAPPEPIPAIDRDSGELPSVAARPRTAVATGAAQVPAAASSVPGRALASSPASSTIASNTSASTASRAGTTNSAVPTTGGAARGMGISRSAASAAPQGTPSGPEGSAPAGPATAPTPAPGFDLARVGAANASSANSVVQTPPNPATLEQVFADLGAPSRASAPIAGAVDVLSIEPAQPAPPPAPAAELAKAPVSKTEEPTPAPKPEATKKPVGKATDKKAAGKKAEGKKAVPSHPSRIWVQTGVGRDEKAIAFDWGRRAKANPALFKGRQPYVTEMGRTNRILVGPFETQKAASDFAAQVKKADVANAFVWTSPAGQVVDRLPD
ncbi:tetratricopeptide repeat protein [Novosphingobium sp. RD2P27]|uniref:Tetratricopeptide repeat protein n=1 Tax=Novosphingobium kalidii TaxID=3230299 RepID=A0ABV2D0S7_9SPHN